MAKVRDLGDDLQLLFIYLILLPLVEGIPRLRWFGQESDYNILVIDLLGSNLETLYLELNSKFTMQTILKLASQMVNS